MGIGVWTVKSLVIAVVFSLAFAEPGHAQLRTPNANAVGGFGRLSWGTTVEQAQAIYRDLYFGKYLVEDSGTEPSRIYFRRDETGEVDGVAFDFIEYSFRQNRFCGIRAVMRSRIGPRSLITRSEESFTRLHESLARRYGRPTKYTESYFTDFVTVTRVAQWDRPDATFVLTYKGPETANEDQLIFELREGGRH